MAIPQSFIRAGYTTMSTIQKKRPRLMIGTEGDTESGKTEFMLSAPGPGIIITADRGHEGMVRNPNPPEARQEDFVFDVVTPMVDMQGDQAQYEKAWLDCKKRTYDALANVDCLTVGLDTHDAIWDMQILADHGRSTKIYPINRTKSNVQHKAFLTRMFDSGKNVICANALKDEYEDMIVNGAIVYDDKGEAKQVKTGEKVRRGWPHHNYLFQVQIRHFKTEPTYNKILKKTIPSKHGIRILKCKSNGALAGTELVGSECNFLTLALLIYPETTPKDWGYK